MGKKSRRAKPNGGDRKNGGSGAAPSSQGPGLLLAGGGFPSSTAVISRIDETYFQNPFRNESTPINGWAREFRAAERELRHDPGNAAVIMSASKAARALREFDRLDQIMRKAESKGVVIEGAENTELVRKWKDECQSHKEEKTVVNESTFTSMLDRAVNEDRNLDTTSIGHVTYNNLNVLQYAAITGDVQLLEKLVALGAALDFVGDHLKTERGGNTVRKPAGATALLMAVLGAMCAHSALSFEPNEPLRRVYDGEVECAIQLVRLGADVDVRLQLPTGRDAKDETYKMLKAAGYIGKTVRELANYAGSGLLVQTIKLLDSEGNKIDRVNCRCGSRLPWKECHAGKDNEVYHSKSNDDDEKLLWKFSPCARCPCKRSTKVYFKCCWDDVTYKQYFQDDETAEISVSMTTAINDDNREFMFDFYNRLKEEPIHYAEGDTHPGQLVMERMNQCFHPKSVVSSWDDSVYMEIQRRLPTDNTFQWDITHWSIPKSELLDRVDVWNKALDMYCDDKGLVGPERESLVDKYTASPFAPCANAKCQEVETKVKGFSFCSRCQSVGYCSSACQREDHPFHKPRCKKV